MMWHKASSHAFAAGFGSRGAHRLGEQGPGLLAAAARRALREQAQGPERDRGAAARADHRGQDQRGLLARLPGELQPALVPEARPHVQQAAGAPLPRQAAEAPLRVFRGQRDLVSRGLRRPPRPGRASAAGEQARLAEGAGLPPEPQAPGRHAERAHLARGAERADAHAPGAGQEPAGLPGAHRRRARVPGAPYQREPDQRRGPQAAAAAPPRC